MLRIGLRNGMFAVSLMALAACSKTKSADSETSSEALQAFTEEVNAGDGVVVKIQYRKELNGGLMVIQGPNAQKAKMDRLSNIKSLSKVYREASGKDTVPARILALEAKVVEANFDTTDFSSFTKSKLDSVSPAVDEGASVKKGVAEWQATWCSRNKIDGALTTNLWFQKTDWCYPWAGGNAAYYKNSVRQAMAMFEVFTGTVNIQLRTKMSDSSTWGAYSTWPITQGNNIIVRTWSNYSTPIDVNFNTTDWQSNEVFGIAIQLADTPTTEMIAAPMPKLLGGRDYYMTVFTCNNTSGYGYYESCEQNSMVQGTDGSLDYRAMQIATNLCSGYGGPYSAYMQRMTIVGGQTGAGCGLWSKNCKVQTDGRLDCNCLGSCDYGYVY